MGASFNGGTIYFTGCEFHGLASFSFADFDCIVDFSRTDFYEPVLFQGTKFRPRTSFGDVRFHAGVDLRAGQQKVLLDSAMAWTEPEDTTLHNFLPSG